MSATVYRNFLVNKNYMQMNIYRNAFDVEKTRRKKECWIFLGEGEMNQVNVSEGDWADHGQIIFIFVKHWATQWSHCGEKKA